jgi:hypothetical protein
VLIVNLLKIKTFLSAGQGIIPKAECGTISAFIPDKLFGPLFKNKFRNREPAQKRGLSLQSEREE